MFVKVHGRNIPILYSPPGSKPNPDGPIYGVPTDYGGLYGGDVVRPDQFGLEMGASAALAGIGAGLGGLIWYLGAEGDPIPEAIDSFELFTEMQTEMEFITPEAEFASEALVDLELDVADAIAEGVGEVVAETAGEIIFETVGEVVAEVAVETTAEVVIAVLETIGEVLLAIFL